MGLARQAAMVARQDWWHLALALRPLVLRAHHRWPDRFGGRVAQELQALVAQARRAAPPHLQQQVLAVKAITVRAVRAAPLALVVRQPARVAPVQNGALPSAAAVAAVAVAPRLHQKLAAQAVRLVPAAAAAVLVPGAVREGRD